MAEDIKKMEMDNAVSEDIDESSLAVGYSINMGSVAVEDDEDQATEYSIKMDTAEVEVEDDDDEVYSPEERLRVFSDLVVSCMVGDKEIKDYAIGRLLTSVNPRIFRDENYVLFSVLYKFRDKIRSIRIDDEFVRMYLNRNRGLISKSRQFIDINSYGEVEGSTELGYISGVVKHFKRLRGMEDISEEEFETYFEKYKIEFKAIETARVYNQASIILTDGLRIGNKTLVGFDDSYNFVRRELADIEGLMDSQNGSGYTNMRDIIMGGRGEEKKPYKIADFDKLSKLNEIYGGIYTGMFYQVMAPAKAGKSKFCTRVCHTAMVKYGTNVTVWPVEGGANGWTAQMRAIHFDYTYNQGVQLSERKFGIDQDVIQKDDYPSDSLRELEISSSLDLASNTEYGSVDYIDLPFNLETFIDAIDASVKSNGSKLIIIDYLQLIMSERASSAKHEVIGQAYMKLLAYCRANNVAILTPAQYKQESINELLNSKDTSSADMRTAGGNSSEVIRTPDITFALWASTSDLVNNRMKVLSMPSRFAKPFPEINTVVDLGICQFISVDE